MNRLPKKIRILAPEGFFNCGWQRIVCLDTSDNNLSLPVANMMNRNGVKLTAQEYNMDWFYTSGDCFFVLSGESFSIQDLAAAIGEMLRGTGTEVEAVDED